jgi:hypothetical protein
VSRGTATLALQRIADRSGGTRAADRGARGSGAAGAGVRHAAPPMRRPLALLALAAALVAAAPARAQDAIPEPDLRRHLEALDRIARENGGNRAAGTPGEAATAAYAADQLAAAGWTVTRPDVAFPYFGERSPPVLGAYRHRTDFATLRYSGSGDVRARVRALGSGCRRREYRRFPRGRIAILAAFGCTYRRAARLAQRAGARAVVIVDFTTRPPIPGTLSGPGLRVPVLTARLPVARRLARRGRLPLRVRVDAFVERRVTQNVVAELPGTEGRRIVMAGGHMDSVPEGAGINDNGSGVAALIEAGRRLAARPRARLTLRLAFWTAEEPGLYGSRAYVRGLPRDERRRLAAYVNLDMVGSPNGVPEVYRGDRRIASALRRHLPGAGGVPIDAGSDHEPFVRAGIPVGGIYTGSLEPKTRAQARRWGGVAGRERDPCYHRPCDGLDNVDLRLLALTASAATNALGDLSR